jgi:hypothetical protein
VVIEAGAEPDTMSFLYDIESSSGNTGRGRIVVEVVRESVPDFPVVADTILTAETREDFPAGVDVLSGKATWSGGEVSGLTVSLWGDSRGVDVDGRRISGELPERTRLIPFAVTGEGASGEVTTYAFLRVPGDDDLSLALRSGLAAPEVAELESVTLDMAALVAKPRGSRLEVGPDVRASGARADSACALDSGSTVRYAAGPGAPWSDSCQVPVRLAGQDDWTYLSVPIAVRARDPQPELRAGSMTVGPGETATFDLHDMTTWQLREGWEDIRYAVDYAGAAFDVTLDGSTVTVTGSDTAVPGSEEAAMVSVTSHTAVAPVRLIIRVGAAPSTLPQGGSVAQQCTQSAGSSCTIPVIGANGEVNPLPRTPLQLLDVRTTGACVGVSVAVASATSVTATWTGDAPGATCTASFSVRDAQGRVTSSERDGRLLIDLLGYPKSPASIAQSGYADGALTLRVDPGEARQAYPALAGFIVRSEGREVVRCGADGACPPISAPNGEQRSYDAVAVNAVGESKSAVRTVAWAYDPPRTPTAVSARPVVTDGDGGIVALAIDGLDPADTGWVEVTSPTGERVRLPVGRDQTQLQIPSYRVGSNSATVITVTPYSRFDLPPGLGGSVSGSTATVTANGIGAPLSPQLSLSSVSNGDGTSTITARATAQLNGDGSQLRYGIVRDGQQCRTSEDGAGATFPGLADGDEYHFDLCVESWWGGESFGRAETTASVRAQQSGRAPRGWTFVVDAAPDLSGQSAAWVIRDQPQSDERVPNRNHVEFQGGPPTSVMGRDPGIQVRYVHDIWGTSTPWATVTPRAGSAPYQVQASWSVSSCVGGSDLATAWSSSNAPNGAQAAVTFGNRNLRYLDATGAVVPHTADTWQVPRGAVRVEGVAVTVDWSAQGWGLSPVSTSFSAMCDPNDPGPPGPQPSP